MLDYSIMNSGNESVGALRIWCSELTKKERRILNFEDRKNWILSNSDIIKVLFSINNCLLFEPFYGLRHDILLYQRLLVLLEDLSTTVIVLIWRFFWGFFIFGGGIANIFNAHIFLAVSWFGLLIIIYCTK